MASPRSFRCCTAWGLACLAWVSPSRAETGLVDDGQDRYSLFDRHLQTRSLRLQLEAPDQTHRLMRSWEPFRAAGDVSIGTQQVYNIQRRQTHFHGFAIADTFLSLRILDGLVVNLNLLAFNPSASDGYRTSAVIKPGIALDADANLFDIAGKPLHLAVTGTDLGEVTLGNGLFLERTPLEGVIGSLSYGDASFSYLYGGRALWADDDLIRSQLSLWSNRLRFMLVEWQQQIALVDPLRLLTPENLETTNTAARFADVTVDLPLPNGFRSAFEYALRLNEGLGSGALLRVDWLRRDLGRLGVHAGYQFRFYQHGFGPRNLVLPPTLPFSFPYQEDAYVTGPFEYLGLGEGFDQWSHTVMLEGRFEIFEDRVELFGFDELWQRSATRASASVRSQKTLEGFQAPGHRFTSYYSAGLSFYPWPKLPHRADVYVTNKQVPGTEGATFKRFETGRFYVLRFRAQF